MIPETGCAVFPPDQHRLTARELFPAVYEQLRSVAARQLRDERADHTLQPTALVHEVFLRLARERRSSWRDPAHFLAVAAQVVRRVLVDHARARGAAKRRAQRRNALLESLPDSHPSWCAEMLALDDAMSRLEVLHERQSRVASMRVFGGMTSEQIAAALDISRATVAADWSVARAWLSRELAGAGPSCPAEGGAA